MRFIGVYVLDLTLLKLLLLLLISWHASSTTSGAVLSQLGSWQLLVILRQDRDNSLPFQDFGIPSTVIA